LEGGASSTAFSSSETMGRFISAAMLGAAKAVSATAAEEEDAEAACVGAAAAAAAYGSPACRGESSFDAGPAGCALALVLAPSAVRPRAAAVGRAAVARAPVLADALGRAADLAREDMVAPGSTLWAEQAWAAAQRMKMAQQWHLR
jgi:hypothetical protein